MALGNPMEAILQAYAQKEKNRQDMLQNIAGIGQGLGQGLGSIGDYIGQQKRKQIMDQLKEAMKTQGAPQQGPQMPQPMSAGTNNVGQDVKMPPTSGMGGPAQDNTATINQLFTQLYPEQSAQSFFKSQIPKRTMGGSGKRVVYQNPDGSVSLTPAEGAIPLEVSDAQAMQYTAVPKSAKEKNVAMSSRAEAIQRGIDVRQIDQLAKSIGITPGQRNLLQQNNMRASRAVELASKPMTWQEFNNVLTDAAAIMQGGVPHIDQIHNMTYPTWQEDFAKWKTLATSQPTMNVPPEIRNRVIDMVRGIQKVDNRYLAKNAQFQQQMLGPTVRGGIAQFQKPISEMTDVITSSGESAPPASGGWSYVGKAQ